MAKLYNLARMSTATTGTGTIALGSAVPPFLTFAQAGVQDGETVTYSIIDGTTNSEIGRGIYTASGTTLTRTVLKSTNSNSAINLSGSAQVLVTAAAEDIITPGASQAQAEAGTDNSTVMTPLRVAQSIVANAQPTKNIVGRNGGLEVWQRGASISVAASAVAYAADGWYLATGASQASTVSRQGGALSNGSRFSAPGAAKQRAGRYGDNANLFPARGGRARPDAGKVCRPQLHRHNGGGLVANQRHSQFQFVLRNRRRRKAERDGVYLGEQSDHGVAKSCAKLCPGPADFLRLSGGQWVDRAG